VSAFSAGYALIVAGLDIPGLLELWFKDGDDTH